MTLAQEKFPGLFPYQYEAMSMAAATSWYNGEETELAQLFEQYVMIKQLKGVEQ